jgi:hypothetical protein
MDTQETLIIVAIMVLLSGVAIALLSCMAVEGYRVLANAIDQYRLDHGNMGYGKRRQIRTRMMRR